MTNAKGNDTDFEITEPQFSSDVNDEETNNEYNISWLLINDDDVDGNNTDADNHILDENEQSQKKRQFFYWECLLLTYKKRWKKGTHNIEHELSTTTAQQCASRNIISTNRR